MVATILVDLCGLLREGLIRVLAETHFRIVPFAGGSDQLPRLACDAQKKVLLIIGAGNDPNALVTRIKSFREQYASAHCVVIGDLYEPSALLSVLHAGADAFLPKSVSTDALVKTLELVMLGETILPAGMASAIGTHIEEQKEEPLPAGLHQPESMDDPVLHRLSEREVDTLYCLLRGDSNKLIARKFAIAEATVKVHIKAILRKIRVHNRTQAAIWAMDHLPRSAPRRNLSNANHENRMGSIAMHNGHVGQQLAS